MIGLFDSGHGGLTILRALSQRFPNQHFIYLGDHANAPYGERQSEDIVELTRMNVERLFGYGCRLVVLACNTATAVACRQLQQEWLPNSKYDDHNVLGIIAPVVEISTQTPWAVTTPQYPQKLNSDQIGVFATTRTVSTNVYVEEIGKRCPKVRVVQQACPSLAGKIDGGAAMDELDALVSEYVEEMLMKCGDEVPHRVILGCTHFPLIEPLFHKYLPASTRILCQPSIVADSLEDYLGRHPHYLGERGEASAHTLFTTGESGLVNSSLGPIFAGQPEADRYVFRAV